MPNVLDPLVIIVIVNWNGIEDTIKCVNSALSLSYPHFKVIVIDNGSKVNEAESLKKIYNGSICVLRTKVNKGYAAGANYGVKFALNKFQDAKYFLISNNDVVFETDYLEKIIRFMEMEPNVGIATGKIMLMGMRDIIYSIGQKWNLKIGFVKNVGFGAQDSKKLKLCEVDFVPGVAFVIKREVIEKIGLLDEGYFLYFEEPDYCLRAKKAGYKTFLIPESIAHHKFAASTNKVKLFAFYYYQRSRLRFIIKNLQSVYLPLAMLINIIDILVSSYLSSVRRKNPLLVYYSIKAVFWNLLNFKRIRAVSSSSS